MSMLNLQEKIMAEMNKTKTRKTAEGKYSSKPEHKERKIQCMICEEHTSALWFTSNHLQRTHDMTIDDYLDFFYVLKPTETIKAQLEGKTAVTKTNEVRTRTPEVEDLEEDSLLEGLDLDS